MRPFLFLLALLTAAGTASAQVSIAPEVGVNLSTYSSSGNLSFLQGGLRAGVKADIGLGRYLSLQPGIFYAGNGFSPLHRLGGSNISMRIRTIELPVQLVLIPAGNQPVKPFVGVGGYVGLNAGGTSSFSGTTYPFPTDGSSRPLKAGNNMGSDIRPLDAGVNISAGLQLRNGLYARVLLQKGLTNLIPDGNYGGSMKSYNAGLTLGYFFHCSHEHKPTAVAEKKQAAAGGQ